MMNIDTTYSLYALLISNALLVGAAGLAVMRLQRLVDKQKVFWSSPTGATLKEQIKYDELLLAIDQRLSPLFEQIESMVREQGQEAGTQQSLPIEHAVRMAKHGASREDLMRNCGLSDTEARLLIRVHVQPASSEKLN